jgi:thiol-disulfide isomerase/thioredoxin
MIKRALVLLTLTLVFMMASCKRGEQPASTSSSGTAGYGFGDKKAAAAKALPEGIEVGTRLPAYAATSLDGSKFDLQGKRGKVVLLNAWATWCGPCRFEIPELQRMQNQYASKGFEVIGVSLDEGDVDGVKNFVGEQKVTYPIVLDPEQKLANLLQISVLPTTVLLDRDGKIVWKKMGAIFENDAELKKAIESAL